MKISQREMILGVATLATLLTGLTWYIVDNKMDEYHAKAAEIEKLKQQIGFHKNAIKKTCGCSTSIKSRSPPS